MNSGNTSLRWTIALAIFDRRTGAIATTYMEAIRNPPFLVQLLFIFFGISSPGPKLGSG